MAFGENAGGNQDLADVVLVAPGWELVEELVAEGLTGGGQLREQLRVWTSLEPVEEAARALSRGEGLRNRL